MSGSISCAPCSHERLSLGAPAHRARDVEPRGSLAATGKHEALELGELRVEAVAVDLERVDLLLRRAQPPFVLERHREIGAEVEELVLDADEHVADVVRALSRDDDAEQRS